MNKSAILFWMLLAFFHITSDASNVFNRLQQRNRPNTKTTTHNTIDSHLSNNYLLNNASRQQPMNPEKSEDKTKNRVQKGIPTIFRLQDSRTATHFTPNLKPMREQYPFLPNRIFPLNRTILNITSDIKKQNRPYLILLPNSALMSKIYIKEFLMNQSSQNFSQSPRVKKSDSLSVLYECNIIICPSGSNSSDSDRCLPLCAPIRTSPQQLLTPFQLFNKKLPTESPLQTMKNRAQQNQSSSIPPQFLKRLMPTLTRLFPQVLRWEIQPDEPPNDEFSERFIQPGPTPEPQIQITPIIPPQQPLLIVTQPPHENEIITSHPPNIPVKSMEVEFLAPQAPLQSNLVQQLLLPNQRPQRKQLPSGPSPLHQTRIKTPIPKEAFVKYNPLRPKLQQSSPPPEHNRRRQYPPDPGHLYDTPVRTSANITCSDRQFPNNCVPGSISPRPHLPDRVHPNPIQLPVDFIQRNIPYLHMLPPQVPSRKFIPPINRPPPQVPWQADEPQQNMPIDLTLQEIPIPLHPPPQLPIQEKMHTLQPNPPQHMNPRIIQYIPPLQLLPPQLEKLQTLMPPKLPPMVHRIPLVNLPSLNLPPQLKTMQTLVPPKLPPMIHSIPSDDKPSLYTQTRTTPSSTPVFETIFRSTRPTEFCNKAFPCYEKPITSIPYYEIPFSNTLHPPQDDPIEFVNELRPTTQQIPQVMRRSKLNTPIHIAPHISFNMQDTPPLLEEIQGSILPLQEPALLPPQMPKKRTMATPHVVPQKTDRTPPRELPCSKNIPHRNCTTILITPKPAPSHAPETLLPNMILITRPPSTDSPPIINSPPELVPFQVSPLPPVLHRRVAFPPHYIPPQIPIDATEIPSTPPLQIPKKPSTTMVPQLIKKIQRSTTLPPNIPPQIKPIKPLSNPCTITGKVKCKVIIHDQQDHDDNTNSAHNVSPANIELSQNLNSHMSLMPLQHDTLELLTKTMNLTHNVIDINNGNDKMHKHYGERYHGSSQQMETVSKNHLLLPRDISKMKQDVDEGSPKITSRKHDNMVPTPAMLYFYGMS